jgi:phosphatidylglycerophosphatase A
MAPAGFGPTPLNSPRRADWRFALSHPAHLVALGFGSGLVPKAPGTAGTLWAWAVFAVIERAFPAASWPLILTASALGGVWACTRCARDLGIADPGVIVWDEVLAFWLLLWLIAPAPGWMQALAFGLFRFFDAVKPGPVGWADRHFKLRSGEAIGWRQGLGIVVDDLVAAAISLGVLALVGGLLMGFGAPRWHWL